MKTALVGGLALLSASLPTRPAHSSNVVPAQKNTVAEDKFAGESGRDEERAVKTITADVKTDVILAKEEESAPPERKAAIQAKRAELGSRIASLAGRFKRSPTVQDAGAGFMMARKDFAGAGRLAEQGLKYARPDGDPNLTGRLPFQGGLMLEDKLAGRFAAVSTYVPETSGLHGFFQKALAPKTENRFHSAREFFEDLKMAGAKGFSDGF